MNDIDRCVVRAWRESVTIPTYGVGMPDPNPMFLEKRVYQGSSGSVYPLPIIDRISDEKKDAIYDAVFLENEYLRIMILPELGGRVQMALDKTNDYHFIYYNRVIKPALVGLAGPWISGGIEFNWPQHHRPSTFLPVDSSIEESADGSCTVWCSEIDCMSRTKGMHGFVLHPGKSYLEVKVRLFNRTSEPQSFLWWANPAIAVDENHQSMFPPDVNVVMDHGKRDVSGFPIATGVYYKVDYSPGTDISRYANIPVPTSYMAFHSNFNFVGSYDHGRKAGLLHVANRHVSPGKKQWTWGNGDFGRAWDRHLTDEDGPYIELMCGVYTDNQPDFTWLMPGEEKSFSQYFMPYKGVGRVGDATIDAVVGLEVNGETVTIRVYATSVQEQARIVLERHEAILLTSVADLSPADFFEISFQSDGEETETDLRVAVYDQAGNRLVCYQPPVVDGDDIPDHAKAIDAPDQLDSVESLYLAGLHLEQYRHATREPEEFYREGLHRDPGDARCNNAMGLLMLRRGQFSVAESHFRRSVQRLQRHNPNPYDGEPFYNLGRALVMQEHFADAYDAFYKATWNDAWQAQSFFVQGGIGRRGAEYGNAVELLNRSLARNVNHHQAIHLKVLTLAKEGDVDAAIELGLREMINDPFNSGVRFELDQLGVSTEDESGRTPFNVDRNKLELAIEYAHAGQYDRSVAVLQRRSSACDQLFSPMSLYYLSDFQRRKGDVAKAKKTATLASKACPRGCFPNRLESIRVLESAIENDPSDARARYYLGNLWYSKRQYDNAVECWEASRDLDAEFVTVWRNLGLAYFNKGNDSAASREAFEKALKLDPSDARILLEFDQLAKRQGNTATSRLERLNSNSELVAARDDLALEKVSLMNFVGEHQLALDSILGRRFHPWEGGEGKVPAQFILAVTELARAALVADRPQEALELLQKTDQWPASLGEGKLPGIQENNIEYLKGCAFRATGQHRAANEHFLKASTGLNEPTSAVYYNDQPPDMIFYQGLALRALGKSDEARLRFNSLVDYGLIHLNDEIEIDYFAVSLPDFLVFDDDLNRRHKAHCHYMMALGHLGLGRRDAAVEQFDQVLGLDPFHQNAHLHRMLVLTETDLKSIDP